MLVHRDIRALRVILDYRVTKDLKDHRVAWFFLAQERFMQVVHRVQLDHKDLMDTRALKVIRVLPVHVETRVQEEDRVHEDHRVFPIHLLVVYRVHRVQLVTEETRVQALTI